MPRKNNKDKGRRNEVSRYPSRTPRPKPVVDFTIDQLHAANVELLRRYVTEQGKILPRKYTGLPNAAHEVDFRCPFTASMVTRHGRIFVPLRKCLPEKDQSDWLRR